MEKLTYYQVNKLCKLKPQGIVTIKYHAGGETIPVQLKTQLSLVETSAFVDYVILGSFTDDGDYNPEYQELMIFGAVLRFLSNVPLPETEDYEGEERLIDLATLHELMNSTDLLIPHPTPCIIPRTKTNAGSWKLFDPTGIAWCSKRLRSSKQKMASNSDLKNIPENRHPSGGSLFLSKGR